ncbi:hypothetical protein PQQ99_39405, partial [Paraburkholderia sediminicola]
VAMDYGQATAWFRKSAEHGNAEAMFNMGQAYQDGLGIERDPAQAREWHQRATAEGYVSAPSPQSGGATGVDAR